MKPTPGRIVLYTLQSQNDVRPEVVGQERPALIIRVTECNEEVRAIEALVFLAVDDNIAQAEPNTMRVTRFGVGDEPCHGELHWPKIVPPPALPVLPPATVNTPELTEPPATPATPADS